MEGTLVKKSAWLKSWNARFCVLDSKRKVITYFKAQDDSQPKGEIMLDRAVLANSSSKPFAFVITTAVGEQNMLAASSDSDKQAWMTAVADCISGRKPKPQVAAATAPAAGTTAEKAQERKPAAMQPPPPPPGATDPLAYLMDVGGDPAPSGNAGDGAASQKAAAAPRTSPPKPKPKSSTAAPSFFMSSSSAPKASSKKYPSTGEGLRDAIKEKNEAEVKRLLAAAPQLCTYADQQGQTLLHLASMFGHTPIAILLVQAGADPLAKNPQGETPVDLAPMVLGTKLKKAAAERSA